MSLILLQNAAFGPQRSDVTGSTGVGYTILDVAGDIVSARTTTGVYELASGSGLYAADVTYPDNFNGQIVWDCPSVTGSYGQILSQAFATEQYNYEANDPTVQATYALLSGTIAPNLQAIYDIEYGRWKLDPVANTMTFYDPTGTVILAVFNMFDNTFAPATDAVFQRQNAAYTSPGP